MLSNVRFHPVSPPSDKEVVKVAERIALRIERLMIRRGMALSGSEKDVEFGNEQPLLADFSCLRILLSMI
jgi:hypothetical protein